MKRYNSVEPSGAVIGKANKYWTLWYVGEPEERLSWYGSQTVQNFTYTQNLSYDKEKAIEKVEERYGDEYRIDETVRGSSSYSNELSSIKWNPSLFLFGKYREKEFSEVDDIDYKIWYLRNTLNTEKESPELIDELKELGVYLEYNGEWIFIDDLNDKVQKVFEEKFRRREHFGVEGNTYEGWVRLRDVRHVNTTYGVMTVYEFVNQDGQLLFYKGSKDLPIENDQIVRIKGKVKHESYYSRYHSKNIEETSIKYPKIIKK